jgi:hypothetical protein
MNHINQQLFLDNLKKSINNKFERKFSSHIIKIAQEDNNDNPINYERKIRDAITDLGVTTTNHPLLLKIFEEIISLNILEIFQQSTNPNINDAVDTALQNFKNEASKYREEINHLLQQQTYIPPTDQTFSSIADFIQNIPPEHLPHPPQSDTKTLDDALQIRARYMTRLQDKIEKLRKIAEKIGVPAPTLEIISEDMIIDEKTGVAEKWYTVRVHGDSPQINGWRLIAKLEHSPTERNLV